MVQQHIECALCGTNVGAVDDWSNGWRLYKWALAIRNTDDAKFVRYSTEKWVAAHLLALVDSHAIRKFVVHDGENEMKTAILVSQQRQLHTRYQNIEVLTSKLWIFTPDLNFSSSVGADERRDPTRAMKVLWQPVLNPQQVLSQQSSSLEEVLLPRHICKILVQTLENSRSLLPASVRTFQEWNVGLLPRFSASDVQT